MRQKIRVWHNLHDDDPLSGLINLFDLWIVVVVALMFMLLRASIDTGKSSHSSQTEQATADEFIKLKTYRATESELTGKGTRLGMAYRLESGEIVYTPE